MKDKIDPVTTEVIGRHVLAAAEEMGVTLMRTAFSPNIKERNDFSTAIFNARGEVVAQAEHVPKKPKVKPVSKDGQAERTGKFSKAASAEVMQAAEDEAKSRGVTVRGAAWKLNLTPSTRVVSIS